MLRIQPHATLRAWFLGQKQPVLRVWSQLEERSGDVLGFLPQLVRYLSNCSLHVYSNVLTDFSYYNTFGVRARALVVILFSSPVWPFSMIDRRRIKVAIAQRKSLKVKFYQQRVAAVTAYLYCESDYCTPAEVGLDKI